MHGCITVDRQTRFQMGLRQKLWTAVVLMSSDVLTWNVFLNLDDLSKVPLREIIQILSLS